MTTLFTYDEIASSGIAIKCLSNGEHHFSTCQIIITDVSSIVACHISFAELPSANSF